MTNIIKPEYPVTFFFGHCFQANSTVTKEGEYRITIYYANPKDGVCETLKFRQTYMN